MDGYQTEMPQRHHLTQLFSALLSMCYNELPNGKLVPTKSVQLNKKSLDEIRSIFKDMKLRRAPIEEAEESIKIAEPKYTEEQKYWRAYGQQKMKRHEVDKLELYDDCIVATQRCGKRFRFRKEDHYIFKMPIIVRQGNAPWRGDNVNVEINV
jgi:hypothetical protein